MRCTWTWSLIRGQTKAKCTPNNPWRKVCRLGNGIKLLENGILLISMRAIDQCPRVRDRSPGLARITCQFLAALRPSGRARLPHNTDRIPSTYCYAPYPYSRNSAGCPFCSYFNYYFKARGSLPGTSASMSQPPVSAAVQTPHQTSCECCV